MNDIIKTNKAPNPVGKYPHARRVGSLLFLSGVGPRKPGTSGNHGIDTICMRATGSPVISVAVAVAVGGEEGRDLCLCLFVSFVIHVYI